MGGKKFAKSAINWATMAQRVPEHQKANFVAFKSKSDAYLRAVQNLPETLPTIDWLYYQTRVDIPGLVGDFEKEYSRVEVPYPEDGVTPQVDILEREVREDIARFKEASDARIAAYKRELERINAMIPYHEMTMEEYADAEPEVAIDPIKRPTFWPHTAEEQPCYDEKMKVEKEAAELEEKELMGQTKEGEEGKEKAKGEEKKESKK